MVPVQAMDVTTTRLQLPPQPTSPGEARRFVGDVLRGHGLDAHEVVEAALLLTSELVTNAVLYAAGTIDVDVDIDLRGVRVEVGDHSAEPPSPRDASPEETSGRGLHLVDAMARAWGVESQRDDGKVVWFELDVPPLRAGP
jgi:anti-sigma regulatory factor (Ser/Thr protein kinase)